MSPLLVFSPPLCPVWQKRVNELLFWVLLHLASVKPWQWETKATWTSYNKRHTHKKKVGYNAVQKSFLLLWSKTPKRPVTSQCKLRQGPLETPPLFGIKKQWEIGINYHWVCGCGPKTKARNNSHVQQLSITAQLWVPSQSCPFHIDSLNKLPLTSLSQPNTGLTLNRSKPRLGARPKPCSQTLAFCALPLLAAKWNVLAVTH